MTATANLPTILAECAERALTKFPGTARTDTDDRTFYFTALLAYLLCNAGDPVGPKLLDLVALDGEAERHCTALADELRLPPDYVPPAEDEIASKPLIASIAEILADELAIPSKK